MDLGLERAGFDNVGCIEIDDAAKATLALNRPDWTQLGSGDVTEVSTWLTPELLGLAPRELDLLAGGPPCQPFSTASQWSSGGRRGMDDERAQTIHSLLELVERFLPRAVLLENVLGFVQGKASALPAIESRLEQIEERAGARYSLHWKLVNAADFGVPQNRRRVIVVMIRDGDDEWNWPVETHTLEPVTAWDALHDLVEKDLPAPQGKWAGLLPSIPEGQNYQWLTSRGGGSEVFGYRTKYWNFLLKLARDHPAWTLAASPGPSSGPFHWNNRPLSVREMLRLQSFPDEWNLPGDYRGQVRLAGNATPPLLAEVMGRAIAARLQERKIVGRPSLMKSHTDAVFDAVEPSPVPVEYSALVGPKPDHPGTGLGPAGRAIVQRYA